MKYVGAIVLLLVYAGSSCQAQDLDAQEIISFMSKIRERWAPPSSNCQPAAVVFNIRLQRDGTLMAPPVLKVAPSCALGPALAESAKRAILASAPFTMFKQEHYEKWKDIDVNLDPLTSVVPDQRLARQAEIDQQQEEIKQHQAEIRRQQEALLEQQRLQRQQREEVKRQLASGADALSGKWASANIQLDIRKEGPIYIVKSTNGHGSVNGEFGGPYRDNQIQLNSTWGNVTVIESTGEILFAGERFTRINQ